MGVFYIFPISSKAQIAADQSLQNPSIVIQNNTTTTITGGTRAGNNLLHSFSTFNILKNYNAYFNNNLSISNIIARVTGKTISNIDGLISTNGSANLFIINPNGIIFGENVRLSVGGSFTASTANKLIFDDGNIIAIDQQKPLLTVGIPVGLNLGANSGEITVNGTPRTIISNELGQPIITASSPTGLAVTNGNITLIGNGIKLDGGTLSSNGGNLNLISLSSGTAIFNDSLLLNATPADITLKNRSTLDASGINGGSINLTGRNISFENGSIGFIQNYGPIGSGDIKVLAIGLLTLDGLASDGSIPSGLFNFSLGDNGGDINIKAIMLSLSNGAAINTKSFSFGSGGDININANQVDILGFNNLDPSIISGIGSYTFGTGKGGNITINTSNFLAKDGGSVVAGTFSTAQGGSVSVLSESILLEGYNLFNIVPSQISTISIGSGDSGNIDIISKSLTLNSGGSVYSIALTLGDSGNIKVTTDTLLISSLFVSGTPPLESVFSPFNFSDRLTLGSITSGKLNPPDSIKELFGITGEISGKSGTVDISSRYTRLENGGLISVINQGKGDSGDLIISGDTLYLDDGLISAESSSGKGGNIKLNVDKTILNNGSITASANNGEGGNIFINSSVIVGNNSSSFISADSNSSLGGRISIISEGIIFPENNITASSRLGSRFNGSVQINAYNFTVNPKIVSNIVPSRTLAPITCDLYASKGLVIRNSEIPSQAMEPLEFLTSKPHPKFYRDFQTNQRVPYPTEAVGWIENMDGSARTISIAETQTSDDSFLVSKCIDRK